MASSARQHPPPPIYALDQSATPKVHGSMMDDLIRTMCEPAEIGGGAGVGGGKTVEEVWKEITGRKMDGGGDGSGFGNGMTLEEYLNKEDVRVPAGFGVDLQPPPPPPPPAMSQQQAQIEVENQIQVLGFENGAESEAKGRGRGRKRPVLDPVDRAAMQRQKRMIKNRESAARSRERKQAYTVELESLVTQLEEENLRLIREQEKFDRQRLKQILENVIPVTEGKKTPRQLRPTKSM